MTTTGEEPTDDPNHDLLPTVTAILRFQAYVGMMAATGPDMAITMALHVRHLHDGVAKILHDRIAGRSS